MKTRTTAILAFTTVGVIAVLLPWMKDPGTTFREAIEKELLNINKLLFLLAMITLATIIFIGRKKEALQHNYRLIINIIVRLSVVLLLKFYFNPTEFKPKNGFSTINSSISLGFVLASLATLGVFIVMSIKTHEEINGNSSKKT